MIPFIVKHRRQLLWVGLGIALVLTFFKLYEAVAGFGGFLMLVFGAKETTQDKLDKHEALVKDADAFAEKREAETTRAANAAGEKREAEIDDWLNGDWK